MKKYGCFFVLLILIGSTIGMAQEPLSFRNRALGGIVNDDLDLVYDPIELRFVDTLHLYTNLSNLSSTQEKILSNISDNEFLMGVSRKNPFVDNLWTSLLARFQKSKAANPFWIDTDLNGLPDDYGQGTLQDEYTAYLDLNGNGLYDLKRSISQTKSSTLLTDGYSFVLNNSFLMANWTMGLKLVYGDRTTEGNTASAPLGTGGSMLFGSTYGDPTFSRSIDEFLIDSNYTSLRWSEKGDFIRNQDNPMFRIGLAGMVPVRDFEFRGDVQFHTLKSSVETNDNYTGGYEYFLPSVSGYTRKYSESATNIGGWKMNGSGFGFGGLARYTFDKQPHRRNDGYVSAGINVDFGSFDYTSSSSTNSTSNEMVFDSTGLLIDFSRASSGASSNNDNGDGKNNMIQFLGRLNVPLADGVMFGLGAFYSISSTERNTKYDESTRTASDYSLRDNVQNAFDTLRTVSSGLTADRTFKVKAVSLSIPVGIEYYFTENHCWALRFGSVFQYSSQTTDDVMQITDSKPYTTKTVLGSGSTSVDVQNNIYTSRSQHALEGESHTFFTYGLGYFPTNNLQIDVLGFFDVNNNVTLLELLKSLRLSFVLKM